MPLVAAAAWLFGGQSVDEKKKDGTISVGALEQC